MSSWPVGLDLLNCQVAVFRMEQSPFDAVSLTLASQVSAAADSAIAILVDL